MLRSCSDNLFSNVGDPTVHDNAILKVRHGGSVLPFDESRSVTLVLVFSEAKTPGHLLNDLMLEIISENGGLSRMIWSFTMIEVVIFIGGKCVDLGNVEVVVGRGSDGCEVRIKIAGRRRWV